MDDTPKMKQPDFIALTGDVVSAYVSNNSIRTADLSSLIDEVYQALFRLSAPVETEQDKREKPTPAQIRKSVTPDALISFEDGKPYKTLRRHLTIRGLTPEMYRTKHGLPVDYPMTSASYSAQRSALAQSLGLGRHRQETKDLKETSDEAVAETPLAPKAGRGRPRKIAVAAETE